MKHPLSPRACPFCAIAAGEIPAHRVHEDDHLVAFLDRGPIRTGHIQIIPRRHYPYFDDLPPALAGEIVQLGQRLAVALKRIHGVERVAFLFTGGDIAHAHAHIVPMVEGDDITSRRYIVQSEVTYRDAPLASVDELRASAAAIRQAMAD
ncbi:MAG: HIT family protein [Rhizobiales bacterium]|nr:HIT family protein [Hyphomicrobiales bacterium]